MFSSTSSSEVAYDFSPCTAYGIRYFHNAWCPSPVVAERSEATNLDDGSPLGFVCNASAYCREHRRARHGGFQRWLIVEGISVKADKTGKESKGRA